MLDRQTDKLGRYNNLDVIKGICILLVVFTHFSWSEDDRLRFLFPFWVDMAVPIFMIVSGYVYSLSFEKHGLDTISKSYSIFISSKKVIRYTVPFLLIFILEVILETIKQGHLYSPGSLFYFFLRGANGPGSYYYPVLFQLVFLFPIIYFIIKKFDFNGLIICFIINYIYEILKNAYYINDASYRLLVFRYIFVIAFGCYLAVGKKQIKWQIYLAWFGIGVMYIVLFRFFGITPIFTQYWTGTSFWACMYILPIAAFLISRKNLRFKPLEIIGKASYNIFLFQMVFYGYCSGLVNNLFSFINSKLLLLFLYIMICVTIGIVFYYIETPLTKLIIKMNNSLLKKLHTKKLQNELNSVVK